MSKKPRRPYFYPKMKVRGSKRRRLIRQNEAYILSGRFAKDVTAMSEAMVEGFNLMTTVVAKAADGLVEFIEAFGPEPKQSDFALAAPSSN